MIREIRAFADALCAACALRAHEVVKSSSSLPLLYTCNAVIINVRSLWHTSQRDAAFYFQWLEPISCSHVAADC
jgi:hypothetical protein